jgi:hypothetical protein
MATKASDIRLFFFTFLHYRRLEQNGGGPPPCRPGDSLSRVDTSPEPYRRIAYAERELYTRGIRSLALSRERLSDLYLVTLTTTHQSRDQFL